MQSPLLLSCRCEACDWAMLTVMVPAGSRLTVQAFAAVQPVFLGSVLGGGFLTVGLFGFAVGASVATSGGAVGAIGWTAEMGLGAGVTTAAGAGGAVGAEATCGLSLLPLVIHQAPTPTMIMMMAAAMISGVRSLLEAAWPLSTVSSFGPADTGGAVF